METKAKRLNFADMMKGTAIIWGVCYHLLAPNPIKSSIDHLLMPLLVTFFFYYKITLSGICSLIQIESKES